MTSFHGSAVTEGQLRGEIQACCVGIKDRGSSDMCLVQTRCIDKMLATQTSVPVMKTLQYFETSVNIDKMLATQTSVPVIKALQYFETSVNIFQSTRR